MINQETNEIYTPFGNTYGSLIISEENGYYYFRMEDCFEDDEGEIPQYLFEALKRYTMEYNGITD